MTDTPLIKDGGWRLFAVRLWFPAAIVAAVLAAQAVFTPDESVRSYLQAALIFFSAVLIIRFGEAAVRMWYIGRRRPYPLPNVLRGLILAVVYLFILFYVLKNILRVDLTAYLAGSAVLTMVLGLAFQGVLSNIFSGMSLHFTKSFSRGDWVGIGGHEGVVVDTNWRETRLLDRYSNIIVLPNNIVASEKITNFSQPDSKAAIALPFKLSFGAPAADAIRLLSEAAADCPDVAAVPPPVAQIHSYDEFGVSYVLKFWITDYALKDVITTTVARTAWYKLRRNRLEIAISIGDKLKALTAIEAAPAADDREATFRDLLNSALLRRQHGEKAGELIAAEEEVRALAALLRRGAYTKGEVLCRQGEKGTSCFVVAAGLIRGRIAYEEGGKTYFSEFTVAPGGIFGEMSLFTGMPRTATGTVAEDAELLVIRAEDFGVIIDRNPALAEEIAEIVSARNEQNREFLSKIKELSAKDIQDGTNKKTVLEYLKRFVRGLKKGSAAGPGN